uniref:Unconventional myosin-Vc n=1 Tax=Lygus hesperus TaxID=30085 RepID=A0A0A9YE66_LYGHE
MGCKVRDIENKASSFAPWENIYTLTSPPLQNNSLCLALYDDGTAPQGGGVGGEIYPGKWTTSYYYAMYYHTVVVQSSSVIDSGKVCGTIVYLSDINHCKLLSMDISEITYRFGHNLPWYVESLCGLTHVPVISGLPQSCARYAKAAVQYVERKKQRKQRLFHTQLQVVEQ